ncbi:FMRFamide receptor-like [Physella acuta]|uniref:FMRFamide receptor-like n=1 Tax=Physella acuta TaxID=109671 RepID=UPI0027DB18C6|nr:FMRFamide receptor-like [Physella acuta]
MAIYDLVFLLVNTVFISMDYFHFGVTGLNDWHDAYVSLAQPFVSAFTNVAITGSVYTTVILSIDRTIGIQFPLQWHRICSSRRVKVALCVVFFTSAVLNVPMMMEDRWEYHTKEWSNVTEFQSVSSEYSKTYFHNEVYLRYINPIFDAFVPVIAISTINVIIARSLHQRSRLQKTLISSDPTQDLKSTETKRITSMVICISLETLMTRTTRMVNFIIQGYYGTAYVNACPLYCGVIAALAHFLTITNATFNFFCFCYFGSKFRRCFLQRLKNMGVHAPSVSERNVRTNSEGQKEREKRQEWQKETERDLMRKNGEDRERGRKR